MQQGYNLPPTYSEYVSLLKNFPTERDRLVSNALDLFNNHYDTSISFGHIDSNNQLAYRKLYEAPLGDEIKYAICGPSHQLIADALNEANVQARIANFGAARVAKEGGNHLGLIYKSGQDEYTANDWDKGIKLKATNIMDAYKKAMAEHYSLVDPGKTYIMTKDGKHAAYAEVTIGDKLAKNPDPNSTEELGKKFDIANNEENRFSTNLATKSGTDELGQNYSSNTSSAELSRNFKFSMGELQIDADGSLSHLNVTNKPNDFLSKNTNYSILEGELTGTFKSNPIIANNTSTKAFLSSSINHTDISREATNKLIICPSTGWTVDFNDQGKYDDLQYENILGTTTKIKTENSQTDVTLFSGTRRAQDENTFSSNSSFQTQILSGAEIKASVKQPLVNTEVNLEGKGSAVRVESKYCKTDILAAEGKATIGEENQFSLFGGVEQKNIDLTEVGDKKETTKKYIGAQYQRDFGGVQVGVDGQTSGKDVKFDTHISF